MIMTIMSFTFCCSFYTRS